jgi:hypothetical protein
VFVLPVQEARLCSNNHDLQVAGWLSRSSGGWGSAAVWKLLRRRGSPRTSIRYIRSIANPGDMVSSSTSSSCVPFVPFVRFSMCMCGGSLNSVRLYWGPTAPRPCPGLTPTIQQIRLGRTDNKVS